MCQHAFPDVISGVALNYMQQGQAVSEMIRVLLPGGQADIRVEDFVFDVQRIVRSMRTRKIAASVWEAGWRRGHRRDGLAKLLRRTASSGSSAPGTPPPSRMAGWRRLRDRATRTDGDLSRATDENRPDLSQTLCFVQKGERQRRLSSVLTDVLKEAVSL
jgi:hypothetical protein